MASGSGCIRDWRLPRVIVHLDVDAFFASVEQVLNPALRGRPVIVGSGVVASCSYESRAYGVRTAMRLAEAKRLCPRGVFLAGDYGQYALFANRIEGVCLDYAPRVEQASLDDFYLDFTGCATTPDDWNSPRLSFISGPAPDTPLHGPATMTVAAGRVALALQSQIRAETGLGCSLGVGRNKLFSKLASDAAKPGGIIGVGPDQEAAWLARLPLSELPGAGPKVCEELARYNVHTVAQLAALPESILTRLFGVAGRTLWEYAHGIDERSVRGGGGSGGGGSRTERGEVPGNGPGRNAIGSSRASSISRETTLEQPTADDVFLRGMLSYLTQRALWELRRRHGVARTLAVKLRYGDFQSTMTSRTLREPCNEDRQWVALAWELFVGLYTRRLPVRHLGVELAQLRTSEDGQGQLFDQADTRRQRRLRRALDHVRERFGFQAVVEGETTRLIDRLDQDRRGFRLRTPSLSR